MIRFIITMTFINHPRTNLILKMKYKSFITSKTLIIYEIIF